MGKKHIQPTLMMAMLCLLCSKSLAGQTEYAPPWTAHSENFFMIVMSLHAGNVQKLLPKGVEALANEDGMVATIFEMYDTGRVSGMPDYKIAFVVVEIRNLNSRDGTPGHFAIWGKTDSPESLEVLQNHFGFPYSLAENITVGKEQNAYTGSIGAPGKEMMRVKIEPVPEQPFTGEGIVNMVGLNGERNIVKSEVPYLTSGYTGRIVSFEIQPQGDPVLELIKNATPAWSMVSDNQIFSYSPALPTN
ncbi:MAG TPA: hypothetical protein VF268_02245 [Gammaproteobacteria bacterium]